jgi:hypothetical protein
VETEFGNLVGPNELQSTGGSGAAIADSGMTYIYNAPESGLDKRYEYHWEILRTALEKTKGKYGPYRMVPSNTMTERRQAFELKGATGKLRVVYLSTVPDFEKHLIPIRIPVDKNLGGYVSFLSGRKTKHNLIQSGLLTNCGSLPLVLV